MKKSFRRGDPRGRSYVVIGDENDAVKMVRHNDKFVQNDIVSDLVSLFPFLQHNPPDIIQHHFPIGNFPEQTFPLPGADRDKIRAGPGIIVILQADRMTVMDVGVEGHWGYIAQRNDKWTKNICRGDPLGRPYNNKR